MQIGTEAIDGVSLSAGPGMTSTPAIERGKRQSQHIALSRSRDPPLSSHTAYKRAGTMIMVIVISTMNILFTLPSFPVTLFL